MNSPISFVVVCTNQDCAYFDARRSISRLHLGQDLYAGGGFICSCGREARQLNDDELVTSVVAGAHTPDMLRA